MSVHRRVIVTGSRNWPEGDRDLITTELDQLAAQLAAADTMTVVHGAARGADGAAEDWVTWRKACEIPGPTVYAEPHPAHWEHCTAECTHRPRRHPDGRAYCPQAGHRRNAEMVAAGADFCLAFPLSATHRHSPGTWHCLGLAAAARIPYRRIYPRR